MLEHQYRYLVGIDWGTERHEVCVMDADGQVVAKRQVEHKGEPLSALFDELTGLVDGHPDNLAVAIETPRGAVVESLMERGFHVYAVNPKQLDRFRDRHTVAGSKDDDLDAYVLSDSLRTDRNCFRRVRVDDPLIIQLRELSRGSESLKVELGRLSNQLREQILRYLPQFLELSPGADEPWLWDLMKLVCENTEPARVRLPQVRILLKDHRIRRIDADAVMAKLCDKPPWTTPGTQQAVRAHIKLLLPRLRVTHEQSRDCARQIEALLEELARAPAQGAAEGEIREHRDVQILQSLPGAGKVVVATMLAEASQPLDERDYYTLRSQAGIAPVTKASGKRSRARAAVTMRYACNWRLRNAFYFWAMGALQKDERAKQHYAALRARGHSHGRALRGVVDRLLSMLMAMLKSCTLYNPAKRLSAVAT